MTTEERFTHIEATIQASIEAQAAWQQTFQTAMTGLIEAHTQSQQKLGTLMDSISHYIDAAEARTRRIEENLDALIRVITAEHSNGKGNH